MNTGQICIAPDYLFVHEKVKDKLITAYKKLLSAHFGSNPEKTSDYSKVVNKKHTSRIIEYLNDSLSKEAEIVFGCQSDEEIAYIEPTFVEDVPLDSALMQEEIFGPVLPIITYTDINEVVSHINESEIPLALYMFSTSNKNIDFVIENTRAGGTCINNNNVHFSNTHLPFGGVNNSGIGKSHGYYGFQEFSNARAVMRQHLPSSLELMPLYTDFKRKVINMVVKYL